MPDKPAKLCGQCECDHEVLRREQLLALTLQPALRGLMLTVRAAAMATRVRHGGADATGVAAALNLAYRLAQSGFSDKLAARVESAAALAQDTIQEGSTTNTDG